MSLRPVCAGLAVLALLLAAGCTGKHCCRPGPSTLSSAPPCCPAPSCPNCPGGVPGPGVPGPIPTTAGAPPGFVPGPIH